MGGYVIGLTQDPLKQSVVGEAHFQMLAWRSAAVKHS
jgi:hypothetical protein